MDKQFTWTLVDFTDIVDYVAELVGHSFINIVNIANDIIDNPKDYNGFKAAGIATQLASYRILIGIAAQYMKLKRTETKMPQDRLTVDALMMMYDGLLELINTLKLSARIEMKVLE